MGLVSLRSLVSLAALAAVVLSATDSMAVDPPGPCDASEESDCFHVIDNSGCFLNHPPLAHVLPCIDEGNSTRALEIVRPCPSLPPCLPIYISSLSLVLSSPASVNTSPVIQLCACWGCNGQQLVSLMKNVTCPAGAHA